MSIANVENVEYEDIMYKLSNLTMSNKSQCQNREEKRKSIKSESAKHAVLNFIFFLGGSRSWAKYEG